MFHFSGIEGYTKWDFDVPFRRKGMSHAASAPPDHRHDLADSRRWQALVLLCLAQFMVILDITVVNVALPAIGADLSLDRAALTWVVTAYTLCFGGLMLLGGRLADLLGRRRMFLAGLATFTLASLGAGLAGDGTVLVAARALQGVGAALLSPAALSIITTTFQGRERYRALGVWAALGGAGAAVGVLLGGTLTSGPGWPWVFFVNVPVGVLVAAAVPATVATSPRSSAQGVDVPGAVAITAGVGLLLLGGFVALERTVAAPLVDLRLLASRPVAAGYGVMLAASGLLISGFFLNSLLLQRVMGLTALGT